MYLNKINRLGVESLAIFSYRVIDTTTKLEIPELENSNEFKTFTEVHNRYQQAVSPRNQQLTSKAIVECYDARQLQFSSMYSYVQGLTNSPETDVQAAAQSVFTVLNMYGRYFYKLKIAEQSLRFIRIVESLKAPGLAAQLAKLKLTDKVAQLDLVQREYEDLYMGRGNARLGVVSASSMRKELQDAMKLFMDEVSWMARKANNSEWETLALQLQARLDEMTVSVKASKVTDASTATLAVSKPDSQQSA